LQFLENSRGVACLYHCSHLSAYHCSHSGASAVSCGHKSSTGFLYPLDKGMIFVHKPTVYVKYEQVACVNFARVSSGGSGASRSFDFEVDLKNGNGYTFSSIMKFVTTPCYTLCNGAPPPSLVEMTMDDCLTSLLVRTSRSRTKELRY